MNPTVVRASIYFGIIGLIFGFAMGTGLTRFNWAQYTPWSSLGAGGPSGGDPGAMLDQFDISNLQIERDQLLAGGPPKDGIPAISDPDIVTRAEVDFLEPDDRIVAVTINGESRAYPIRMLNWHEIVNDTLGGVPIAVVYCPLCDSVTVVDRRVEGETLEFGVSGLLYQSNVLMYDRTHDALWSQILLDAVSGPYAGRSLTHYPGWAITSYEQWQDNHPEGTVVTFETGHRRSYERSPYEGYMASEELFFPVKREDDRLGRKDRIIGVRFNDVVRAYPVGAVHRAPAGRLIDDFNGDQLIIEADVESGRTAVLRAPDGARTIHTFWFSWAAAHPETEIYAEE